MTKKLSPKELAALFVEYRELYDQLQEKEQAISEQVLLQGETQKIAGVTATYYNESHKVDYEKAAETVKDDDGFDDVLGQHTEVKKVVSWKGVCEDFHLDLKDFTTDVPARVVVKVK